MSLPTRDEAYALLTEWVESESLRRHMLAVEAALRAYARYYGEDEELLGITGLLHDLDYERHPDMDDQVNGHPRTELRLFRERNYPEELIHATEAHATYLATVYVLPDRDIRQVELSSVKKKWKNRKFTEAIDRDENMQFIQELGVDFDEHVSRVLAAMQEIADDLGVGGQSA